MIIFTLTIITDIFTSYFSKNIVHLSRKEFLPSTKKEENEFSVCGKLLSLN